VNLTLGEPTKANGYPLPSIVNEAVCEVVNSEKFNGYTPSNGCLPAREAIVEKYSTEEAPFTPSDVWLTFGCSGALYSVLSAACEEGDNIVVPRPGFPLAKTICESLKVECRYYDLDPENHFEIKLDTVEAQMDEKTKIFMVINPSNPCGSVFTKAHMEEIVALANKKQVAILADEIYHGLAYDVDSEFFSFPSIGKETPIIVVGGISKIYGVPGWRCGWIIVHNRHGFFDNVVDGLNKLLMIWLHPSSLVQFAIPKILKEVPDEYFENTKVKLRESSALAF
jgi:tyrosine aminotransferase